MKRIVSIIAIISILVSCLGIMPASADTAENETFDATLRTEGNLLVNGAGEAVRLMGLNVPYMGWSDTSEDAVMNGLKVSIDEWEGNAVRLPVVPNLWFGANKERYRKFADEVVEYCAERNVYVILDNHSFYLPDDDDIAFWKDAAARYKDHPYVLYELFNEPAMCTWQQYYEGGEITYVGENDWGQQDNIKINSCGLPALLKAVRETGAKNVCILPGINWSFDLSYCTEENFREFAASVAEEKATGDKNAFIDEYVEKYFMRETTGNGIMYTTHPYPTKPSDWDQYLLDTVLEYPVLVGECGPTERTSGFIRNLTDTDKSYLDTLTSYIDEYEIHLTPWAWGAWPFLNQDPSNKLSAYGSYMKKYFEQSMETKAVTLYSEVDYSGDKFTLEAGGYTYDRLLELGFDLSKLNSASCKQDYYQYTVTLYEKDGFKGKEYTFVPNATNVGKEICGFTPKSIKIARTIPENILTAHGEVIAPGYVENQLPENIIDGKNGTFWKNVSKNPNEVVIELDNVYALNRIRIAHASEASMMSVFNASDYTVSVSTDGKTFTRIVDVTDNSLGLCEYNFEQVFAAYIKIKLTKGSMVDNTAYYLAEVMAYGTEYTGSRENMDVSIGNYTPASEAEAEENNGISSLQITLICVFGGIIVLSAAEVAVLLILKKRKTK